jgi:alkyl hydroperoxide reductase subunit AhpC
MENLGTCLEQLSMKFNTDFYSVIPEDNIFHEYLIYESKSEHVLSRLWFSILPDDNCYILSIYETCEETGHIDVRDIFICVDPEELIKIMEKEYNKAKTA